MHEVRGVGVESTMHGVPGKSYAMTKEQNPNLNQIQPGMDVEDTRDLLGEHDITKPEVSKVIRNQQGKVEDIAVSKGPPFEKKIEVPANEIKAVEPETQKRKDSRKVEIETPPELAQKQRKRDEKALADEKKDGLLSEVQRAMPTAEGMRELEEAKKARQNEQQQSHKG